jgi:hypothetical protein
VTAAVREVMCQMQDASNWLARFIVSLGLRNHRGSLIQHQVSLAHSVDQLVQLASRSQNRLEHQRQHDAC